MKENRVDRCSFGGPDSAAVGFLSSLLDHGVQEAAQEEAIRREFGQVSSFTETSCRPDIMSPLKTAKVGVATSYENRPRSQPQLDPFSTNTEGFSSHPGSLTPYSKLQSQAQTNHLRNSLNTALRKGFSGFDELDLPFEHQAMDDGERNSQQYEMSPEFYPSETEKTFEWRVTSSVATKVIPTDSRIVSITGIIMANYAYC